MKTKKLRTLTATTVMALGMIVFASPAWAETFAVTNTNNEGAGSLRAALTSAAADQATPDSIFFEPGFFDSGARREIVLASALPALGNVEIRGPGAGRLTVRRPASAATFRIFTVGSGRTVTISDLTISGGSSDIGGGIDNAGALTVDQAVVSGNSGNFGGGIVNNIGSTANVSNSTVSGNSAISAGGILNSGGTVNVSNSTVSGNSANNVSGGVYTYEGTVNISNSTVSGNSALSGGGVYNDSNTAAVNVSGTIVAGNSGGTDVAGLFNDRGFNFIGGDPKLGPLADNGGPTKTHLPLPGSPVLDKGDDGSTTPTTDQRGERRPQDIPVIENAPGGDGSDIGAVEVLGNATDDSYATEKDTMLVVRAPGVLGNDALPEGGNISAARLRGPANGLLSLEADGSFRYLPDPGFTGTDSFAYRISDGTNQGNSATVTITVSPPPDTTKPTVLKATPTGTRVFPTANVTASFSEAMDSSTLNKATVKLVKKGARTPVAASVAVSADGKSVTLNPTRSLVRDATYTATITTGAKDLAGNPLAKARTWSFTVKR